MLDLMKHNYYKKLMKLYNDGKLQAVSLSLVDIHHDDWCGIYRGRYCNCDPEIKVRSHGGSSDVLNN